MPLSSVLGAQSLVRPGVCTSSTRPASPFDGQVIYETDTNRVLVWDNSAWVMIANTDSPPGLQLIKTQAVGSTLTSVEVTNVFSADYENYRIIWTGGTGSASEYVYLTLGATATNYYWGFHSVAFSAGTVSSSGASPGTNFPVGFYWTSAIFAEFDLFNPFATDETYFRSNIVTTGGAAYCNGFLNNATSYTAFTLTRGGSTTFSGGTIYVYGYRE